MVSNWHSLSSRARCGNSKVMTPVGFNTIASARTKSFKAGTCASTLLPITRSARKPSWISWVAVCRIEKRDSRGDSGCNGGGCNVACGLDSQRRDVARHEIPQEVSVVARHFNDLAVKPEIETLDHVVDILLRMTQPGIRKGREVG